MKSPLMRPANVLNAAAEDLGREMISEIMLRYGDAFEGADQESRSRLVGGLGVCALLYAARACGLNKIWMIEGVGVAIGETQASQEPLLKSLILEAFERGRALGLEPDA